MNVVHVDTALGWRGGQNQVFHTVTEMARRGHTVHLACRRGGELERRARAAGLEVEGLPFAGDLGPMAAWGLRRLIRRTKPAVVHVHDPHAISAGALASWHLGVPLVATRRVDFALRGGFSRWKYDRCVRVIAVSRAIAGVLRTDGVRDETLRVIYEGVPDRPPQPGGREKLEAAGIPPGARVIGNVAALTDHKDHATLLDAFWRVSGSRPDVWLAIAGDGELRDQLHDRARELGLQRCAFLGFRDDLDALLPVFDVFCLSSHMEGLGTSVLDAMCFARPVVATRAGGTPEAVDDGVTGLLAPVRDAEALARNLGRVLDDPAVAHKLGEAGRRRYEAEFTAGRMVDATLAVYAEVA